MPTLYRYTDDSDRGTGYYVRAAVDSSVVTLQANPIAEELYDALDYEAETDGGDPLPGRLVWSLYGVGLHYTEKQGVDTDREELLNSLQQGDVQLKPHENDKLRKFIQSNLERNEKLTEVAEEFGIEIDKSVRGKTNEEGYGGQGEDDGKSLREIWREVTQEGTEGGSGSEPVLPEEIKKRVNEWGLPNSDDFTQLLSENEGLQESIRRMRDHDWEVKKAEHNDIESELEIGGGTVEFRLNGISYHISSESIGTEFPKGPEQFEISVYDSYSLDAEVDSDEKPTPRMESYGAILNLKKVVNRIRSNDDVNVPAETEEYVELINDFLYDNGLGDSVRGGMPNGIHRKEYGDGDKVTDFIHADVRELSDEERSYAGDDAEHKIPEGAIIVPASDEELEQAMEYLREFADVPHKVQETEDTDEADEEPYDSLDTGIEEKISEGVGDFYIRLQAPTLEDEISLSITDEHITRTPDVEMHDGENKEAHRQLACLSYLYDTSVEFVDILDGYELSNPHAED